MKTTPCAAFLAISGCAIAVHTINLPYDPLGPLNWQPRLAIPADRALAASGQLVVIMRRSPVGQLQLVRIDQTRFAAFPYDSREEVSPMKIDIRLHADHYEMRCESCGKLLETMPNRRNSYFRAGDFLDHVCPAPMHEAARERINAQVGV